MEYTTISDILTLGGGKDYKHLGKGDIPVYGTGGYMTSVDEFLYDGESVGIGRKGTIDKPIYLNGKFWTVDTLFYTHSFKNVIPYFVYALFQSINWRKYSEATGVPSLSKNIIEPIKILLPPLPEQQKIAEILSTVDEKIEVIDQQITETQALKKGLMQRLLTKGIGHTEFKDSPLGMIPVSWDIKILKEECIKINVGFVGTCEKFYCEKNEGVLMIRTGNLSDGKIKYSNLKYVTQEFHNKNTKSKIFEGDLLIARHGSSGQAVLVPKNFEESNCLNIIIIRPKTTLNPEFLKFQFNSNIIKKQVRKKTAGSTQGVVNTKEIATLIILHPPLPEQNKIANILNSIDDKLEVLSEKKTHYQELKQGLMQQLLTGKIRVKV